MKTGKGPDIPGIGIPGCSGKSAVSLHPRLVCAGRRIAGGEEPPRSRDFLEIMYIKSGSGTALVGGEPGGAAFAVGRDDVVICNPGIPHREVSAAGPLELIFAGIRNISLAGLPENCLVPGGGAALHLDGGQAALFDPLFSALAAESESGDLFSRELAALLTRTIVYLLLRLLSEQDENAGHYVKPNEAFLRARAYVDRHYLDIRGIDSLCRDVYISKSHLMFLFRNYLGKSPLRYVVEKKMELAKSLLAASEMRVRDIALRCGYEDTDYFYRIFKKQEGVTPLEYRGMQSLGGMARYNQKI